MRFFCFTCLFLFSVFLLTGPAFAGDNEKAEFEVVKESDWKELVEGDQREGITPRWGKKIKTKEHGDVKIQGPDPDVCEEWFYNNTQPVDLNAGGCSAFYRERGHGNSYTWDMSEEKKRHARRKR